MSFASVFRTLLRAASYVAVSIFYLLGGLKWAVLVGGVAAALALFGAPALFGTLFITGAVVTTIITWSLVGFAFGILSKLFSHKGIPAISAAAEKVARGR